MGTHVWRTMLGAKVPPLLQMAIEAREHQEYKQETDQTVGLLALYCPSRKRSPKRKRLIVIVLAELKKWRVTKNNFCMHFAPGMWPLPPLLNSFRHNCVRYIGGTQKCFPKIRRVGRRRCRRRQTTRNDTEKDSNFCHYNLRISRARWQKMPF